MTTLSRHAGDVPRVVRHPRCCIVKLDIDAFGAAGLHTDPDGRVTALTGEPLLAGTGADTRRDRADDLRALHRAGSCADWSVLRSARGVFTVAHFDPGRGTLTLLTDKLGVRPLYVSVSHDFIAFASALRVLETVPCAQPVIDLHGVTEIAAFGFPLATRTPYLGISLLPGAGRFVARDDHVTLDRYWRWDEIGPGEEDVDALARRAYEAFRAAVRIRLRGDRETVAFLSGGLDSRAVVAALRNDGARVHSFTFGHRGTLDQCLGGMIARALGTMHTEAPLGAAPPQWTRLLADAWGESRRRAPDAVERPRIAWSGDGGSVALGHVYLSERVVSALQAGDAPGAINAYCAEQGITAPRRLFTPPMAKAFGETPQLSALEELEGIRGDRLRAFHIFLMLNDQRRHLRRHFEEIDVNHMEFQLPFFDSEFLAAVMAVPAEACLRHAFYMRWFQLFSDVVRSLPWQTYPGHVPCPLPMPRNALAQWDRRVERQRVNEERRARWRRRRELLAAADFPHALLRRGVLRLAGWADRLGLRDASHLIESAELYRRYWSRSTARQASMAGGTTS